MQINTKRRWVKTSDFRDMNDAELAGKRAIKYLNKLANRKFRRSFRNIPVQELDNFENEIQGGIQSWYH